MMKRNIKRRGFTLVELLIVIVVIGILSAMMMLSSTEAVTSAKASNIVSNMRNLKTAALAYYVDNLDTFDKAENQKKALTEDQQKKVLEYLNNKDSITTADGYKIAVDTTTTGEWYVEYDLSKIGNTTEQLSVSQKLAGRAKSVGLLAGTSETTGTGDNKTANTYVAFTSGTANKVYMRVR